MEKTNYKPVGLDWLDTESLAAYILGKHDEYEDGEIETEELEILLHEKFECSMENFHEIVEHLLPLANMASSPATGEVFRGFSIDLGEGMGMWLVKKNI